ncbi:MAG TPA: alkaline phosphatase, partial [Anaerolineaceae bacterium]|nr:alkaline phosphatase [Anaerolineaceae bacterium]
MSKKTFISTILLFIIFALFTTAWVSRSPEQQSIEENDTYLQMDGNAKYVFLFIGDGMGVAQRNAAELYKANVSNPEGRPEDTDLLMNTFPAQGMNTTYDLTSVIPDSASTATAISSGYKTASGVIGMDPEGTTSYEYITEVAKQNGWKVGIISSVSIDHATPAAFYSHQPSRRLMYEINVDLANSDFDYFAGGQMKSKNKKDADGNPLPNAMGLAVANGFTVAYGRDDFDSLKASDGKVIAVDDVVDGDAAMYYTIDQTKDYITLAEFVEKGIELLENPTGFVMVVEGGKIDWACHANDAAASILDTLAFDDAIAVAYEFYEQHPDETLIVVTGDHETGGLTIGFAGTGYSTYFNRIQNQEMSYIEFGKKLEEFKQEYGADADFENVLPLVEEAFGMYVIPAEEKEVLLKAIEEGALEGASEEAVAAAAAAETELYNSMALTDMEIEVLEQAFEQRMLGIEERASDDYTYMLYGGSDPLSIKLKTILNQKSGLGWGSHSY